MDPGASRIPCLHCGIPVVSRGTRHFCCVGCEIAHAVAGGGAHGEAGLLLARLGIGAFLAMNVMMLALAQYGIEAYSSWPPAVLELLRWLSLLLATPAVALLVEPLLGLGWGRLVRGQVRAELLVVVAALGAYGISAAHTLGGQGPIYFESATMVLLLVTGGSYLAARSRAGARDQMLARFRLEPEEYAVAGAPGAARRGEEVRRGDRLLLRRGQRIPADGVVAGDGPCFLDSSFLTGETQLRAAPRGSPVRAGEVVREGSLELLVERAGEDSTLGQVQRALRRALEDPPRSARLVDRAAQILITGTLVLATLVLVLFWQRGELDEGLRRALSMAVVACPCALGLAAPIVLSQAVGAAARAGVVVQSVEALEHLGRVDVLACDKTGTLTHNELELVSLDVAAGAAPGEVLEVLHALCRASRHPVADSVLRELRAHEPAVLEEVREVPGLGVEARWQGTALRFGAPTWALGDGSPTEGALESVLAQDGRRLATVRLRERLRPGVAALPQRLAALGVGFLVLSGDRQRRCDELGAALDSGAVEGGHTPASKAEALHALRRQGKGVAWLGDGVNDAVAVARADVSMIVDRKLEWLSDAADLVVLGDRVAVLPELIELSRGLRRRIRGNLLWTGFYNAVALTLGCAGLLSPAAAAVTMILGSVAVVHRSLRGPEEGPGAAGAPEPRPLQGAF